MNAKKTICMLSAGAMLVAAAPVFADPPYWARAHGYRDRDHDDRRFVERHYRPEVRAYVVERPVYVERRVYVERPVYYPRRPPITRRHRCMRRLPPTVMVRRAEMC